MKRKMVSMLFGILVVTFSISGISEAGSYGRVRVSGIAVTSANVVVYANQYDAGYQTSECARTDWWWPSGTTHVFWFPKSGNEEKYTLFLTAYLTGKMLWVETAQNNLAFGAGIPCLVNDASLGY